MQPIVPSVLTKLRHYNVLVRLSRCLGGGTAAQLRRLCSLVTRQRFCDTSNCTALLHNHPKTTLTVCGVRRGDDESLGLPTVDFVYLETQILRLHRW